MANPPTPAATTNTHLTNKKADLTAAEIAARLVNDNRSVVVTPDPKNAGKVIVATGLDRDTADTALQVGTKAGSYTDVANDYAAGVAAYGDNLDPATAAVTAKIQARGLTRKERRTQYFHVKGTYDATKVGFGAKLCFVNAKGQPLDTNGAPTDVASAVDAATDDLTGEGESVFNWAQVNKTDGSRTGLPGVYDVEPRQTSLYAPYVGWTAQMTARAY